MLGKGYSKGEIAEIFASEGCEISRHFWRIYRSMESTQNDETTAQTKATAMAHENDETRDEIGPDDAEIRGQNCTENLVYRRANAVAGVDAQITAELKTLKDRFIAAMDDDVNVQNGLTVLFDLAKLLNEYANEDTVKQESVNDLLNQYDAWLQIFGVVFTDPTNLDADIDALVKARDAARAAKDFAKSDEIRDQLAAQGIILEDTPQGTRWRRK